MVAHRGASAVEAENTLRAFEVAVEAGADAVEFDVRMTADDVAVVVHDADVTRTTDGRGPVSSMQLAEVRRLRIAARDGSLTGIPTLEETLAFLTGKAAIDIELKNIPGEPDYEPERQRAAEATLEALHRIAFVGPVMVSSFNPLAIAAVRRSAPGVATGLLTSFGVDASAALEFARTEGHGWVLPYVERVRAAGDGFAASVHDAGLRLGTWLTDDPAEAVELFRGGIDAVATNDPAAVVAARREAFSDERGG